MKALLLILVLIVTAPAVRAQTGRTAMETWPLSTQIIETVRQLTEARTGNPGWTDEFMAARLLESSWVDRIGDVYVLYSPIFRAFTFIRYDQEARISDVRIVLTSEAIKHLNPAGIVQPSPLKILGRFEDGVALITLWRAMEKDKISPLPLFLDNYHLLIDEAAATSIDEARRNLGVPHWRMIDPKGSTCTQIVAKRLDAPKLPDAYQALKAIPRDIAKSMIITDAISGDDGITIILADTVFARTYVFMPMNLKCDLSTVAIRDYFF